MLLSIPTWIIHLLTVSEWLTAILLFRRYAIRSGRLRLQLFAYAMVPHLLGGLAILGFHLSGDRLAWLIAVSRVLTFIGSLSLVAVTILLLSAVRVPKAWLSGAVVALALLWAGAQLATSGQGSAALLPGTNLLYLGFLLLLLVVYRQDRMLFSPLTIFGFWFLLVFVVVSVATTRIATAQLGLPSLSHADALHGASESLLSVSNLLIALGVYRRLRLMPPTSITTACRS